MKEVLKLTGFKRMHTSEGDNKTYQSSWGLVASEQSAKWTCTHDTIMLIAETRMTQSSALVVDLNSDTVTERLRVRQP